MYIYICIYMYIYVYWIYIFYIFLFLDFWHFFLVQHLFLKRGKKFKAINCFKKVLLVLSKNHL